MFSLEKMPVVETALLGHGLPSIKDNLIATLWPPEPAVKLAWLEDGEVRLGNIKEFLARRKNNGWARVSSKNLDQAMADGKSAFLTASAIARAFGTRTLVVTAGMGGIRGDTVSDDLMQLCEGHVMLATTPKDSQDLKATIDFLQKHNVVVLGRQGAFCSGFLFKEPKVKINGIWPGHSELPLSARGLLLLNPIPSKQRLNDRNMLLASETEGETAIQEGIDFHPAVNAALDRLTAGLSSEMQLKSLVNNIQESLIAKPFLMGIQSSYGGVTWLRSNR